MSDKIPVLDTDLDEVAGGNADDLGDVAGGNAADDVGDVAGGMADDGGDGSV